MENKTFKEAIKTYLDERARTDELFAKSYAKENKNLDECCFLHHGGSSEARQCCMYF